MNEDPLEARGAPSQLRVSGSVPLRGRVRVPGDKSVSHRALMIAARAEGVSTIKGIATGEDVARTAAALGHLGAEVVGVGHLGAEVVEGGDDRRLVRVSGGTGRLHEPDRVIDVGNSGTSIRLLAGYVAPFPWRSTFEGDRSISARPMDRIATPLRLMGAGVEGRGPSVLPPLVIVGGRLGGIDYTPPVASAQVKSAVLLAALGAEGETVVREPVTTRTHTEELLAKAGAAISVEQDGRGQVVRVSASRLSPLELEVPSDPSHAAFWVVAACLVPGSEVAAENVYVGPARDGFIEVLRRMGADIELVNQRGMTADLVARHSELVGTTVSGDEVPGVIDEIPVLAVAGAMARGVTEFRDAAELRVKESDRVATTGTMLRSFGAEVELHPDGFEVTGVERLSAGTVDSKGDHRVAMAAAVAGMAAGGSTVVTGWDAVATSYPGFAEDLRALQQVR